MVIPIDENYRRDIAKKISEGSSSFADVQDMQGVTLKRRQDTLGRLAEAGVIDLDTAVRQVNEEFI
ncbi:hypothetical protein ACFS07_32660 [Undibacterium arcticum]